MFKKNFYDWVKYDFTHSQELQGNAKSFLARYYKEYYEMGAAYDELKRLADGLKVGKTSKELVFHKAKEMYSKSKLQIVKEMPDREGIISFRSFNPFKGACEGDMTAAEVVELANMVLDARIDKAIKEYIYNIDHGRKTDNTLDIIDKLFEEQGVKIEFDDNAKLQVNKTECSNQEDVNSEKFKEEAERVYKIIWNSKKDNIVLPIYQEGNIGIYIMGRKNIIKEDWSEGIDRIDGAEELSETEKMVLKKVYESNKAYYCFVDNTPYRDGDSLMPDIIVNVCYDLDDVIKEFGRNRKYTSEIYRNVNGMGDTELLSELGEKYRHYFSKDEMD